MIMPGGCRTPISAGHEVRPTSGTPQVRVRWAAVKAVQRVPGHTELGQVRDQIGARRGRNIGVVAAARELLTLVFYGLRDHHIRALNPPPAAPAISRPAA
jgi:hypothetical protein